jgi:type II secretory pathway pseudopilin PulG
MVEIRISIAGKALNQQSGFTYILVLIALVVVGILAEATAILTSQEIKRDKEKSLLFAGIAYQNAIKNYYHARQQFKQYPKRLDDLLMDNRFAYKQHIRQLYPDPFGNDEWQLIRNKNGGITGVASLSSDTPLKQFGFPYGFEKFENANHYSGWIFEYVPKQIVKK